MVDGDMQINRWLGREERVSLTEPQAHLFGTVWMVFGKYVLLISIAGGAGQTFAQIPGELPQLVFHVANNAFWLLCACVFGEIIQFERIWRAKHPAPKEQAAPANQPIRITAVEDRGAGLVGIQYREYPDRPPEPFIRAVFQVAAQNDGRVSEREMRRLFPDQDTDGWLTTLDREGFTAKAGTYPNAPRVVRKGVTREQALQRFGYIPSPPLPLHLAEIGQGE